MIPKIWPPMNDKQTMHMQKIIINRAILRMTSYKLAG